MVNHHHHAQNDYSNRIWAAVWRLFIFYGCHVCLTTVSKEKKTTEHSYTILETH